MTFLYTYYSRLNYTSRMASWHVPRMHRRRRRPEDALLKRSSISSRFTPSLSHCPTSSFSSTSKNSILLLSKTSLPECDQCRSHCRPSSCYRHNTLEVPSSRSPSTSFPSSMRERTPSSCTQSHRPPNYVALHLIPPIPSAAVVACTAGYTHHRRVAYTTHPYGRTTK